jgi:hypothetical protein
VFYFSWESACSSGGVICSRIIRSSLEPFDLLAHDIDLNLQYARFLYDYSGWNPWVCRKVLG